MLKRFDFIYKHIPIVGKKQITILLVLYIPIISPHIGISSKKPTVGFFDDIPICVYVCVYIYIYPYIPMILWMEEILHHPGWLKP